MKHKKLLLLLVILIVSIIAVCLFAFKPKLSTGIAKIGVDDNTIVGKGFVYKKVRGGYYLLTNYHVIEGTSTIVVKIGNDSYEAERVGLDKYLDLAIIKIKCNKRLYTFGFGSGNKVKTISKDSDDFISGEVTEESVYPIEVNANNDYATDLLKTNIVVEEGYSGSPLLNSVNQVVGIITLKDKDNYAYATDYKTFKKYLSVLERGNAIERPSLGITMVDAANKEILSVYKLKFDTDKGIVVVRSTNDKLKVGDIIIEYDSNKVDTIAFLRYYLFKNNKNDKVKVKIIRNNEEIEEEITLL